MREGVESGCPSKQGAGRWRLSTVGGPWSGTWQQLVVVEAELR